MGHRTAEHIKVASIGNGTAWDDPVHTEATAKSRVVRAHAASRRQRRRYRSQTGRADHPWGASTWVRYRDHVPCHRTETIRRGC